MDATQPLYDVMSVTKAAIGIMYQIYNPYYTNQDLLNMVGYAFGLTGNGRVKWRQNGLEGVCTGTIDQKYGRVFILQFSGQVLASTCRTSLLSLATSLSDL